MRIDTIAIHNFRTFLDCTFRMGEYALVVGANNSGKTNLMDAIRIFYEKGLKYEVSRDFPKKLAVADDESWIDIEFLLADGEYSNLKDDYKRPGNRTRVRKYLQTKKKGADGKQKQGIYAFIGNEVSDEHFYGAKNVQQGKFGELIHIPAVSKLDEHTRLTGPSALRDLLQDILKKLIKASPSYATLTSAFEQFGNVIKAEHTEDNQSLAGLEGDINDGISDWDAQFQLSINPVSDADIVKNLVSFRIRDSALDETFEAGQFGQGFQRHLIYTLIVTAAKYQPKAAPSPKKEFSPDLTLLLFEEPEAFLHPIQQMALFRGLRSLASAETNQVIASSHSPYFVSMSTEDIPAILRLCRNDPCSAGGQMSAEELRTVFLENLKLNELLKGTKKEPLADDWREDMEAVKYFLWLNPERCGLFFAGQVLLVEGPTERVLLNYLLNSGEIAMPKGGLFVLDCMGKFNIHRFMNLLGPLRIRHSVLFDADGDKTYHKEVRQVIESSRNSMTHKIGVFPQAIEDFLGVDKAGSPYRKPQHVMLRYKEGAIKPEKVRDLMSLVESLIQR